MSNSKKKHSIEAALVVTVVTTLMLFILWLLIRYFVMPERVSEPVDTEIPSEVYGQLNLVLTMERLNGIADEKLLTLVNKALEDQKITQHELDEIVKYYNSTLDPNPQKTGLIENVEMMLSEQENNLK